MSLLPFEIDWARAIGRALVPLGALDGATDGVDIGVRYAEEQAQAPWHVGLLLRASLWLVWLAPIWLMARPRTFGSLDDAGRVLVLERLFSHRVYLVRTSGMFLKLTLCQLLLSDEATLAQLGAYDLQEPLAQLRRSAS